MYRPICSHVLDRAGAALALNFVNKHIYVCRLSSDVALSVNNSHNMPISIRLRLVHLLTSLCVCVLQTART